KRDVSFGAAGGTCCSIEEERTLNPEAAFIPRDAAKGFMINEDTALRSAEEPLKVLIKTVLKDLESEASSWELGDWLIDPLTSGEGLREDLGGERGLRARARGAAVLVRVQVVLLAQHVPPPAVQEAVQDVGDGLQAQRGAGQHGAHVAGGGAPRPGSSGSQSRNNERRRRFARERNKEVKAETQLEISRKPVGETP
ncbi:hypothetical protein KUCAC02_036477, partial [Chaenocephalus aceratus]